MRIYQAIPLTAHALIELDSPASHHVARVLRAALGEAITVFNGAGGEYPGTIARIDKKGVGVQLAEPLGRTAESPLQLTLAQGIARGEKMDFIIQKAVELGVSRIVPLITERCNVKLDAERRQKRTEHWRSIVISAAEQCGRNTLPTLAAPEALPTWLPTATADQKFVLAPTGQQCLNDFSVVKTAHVMLLIGPEGGLSTAEIAAATRQGFASLVFGPRILRTETAAIAALTALQCQFGDLAGQPIK